MNSTALVRIVLLVVLSLASTGCELVGDIFQAGVWVGFIGLVLIVVLVFYVLSKLRA